MGVHVIGKILARYGFDDFSGHAYTKIAIYNLLAGRPYPVRGGMIQRVRKGLISTQVVGKENSDVAILKARCRTL